MGYLLALFNWIIFVIEVSRAFTSTVRSMTTYVLAMFRPPPPPRDVRDKVVVVTGAATGLGSEISKRFALLGAQVIMLDIDEEANRQAANELRHLGYNRVLSFPCDVSNENEVNAIAVRTLKYFGKVDILVNNAAWWEPMMASPLIQSPSEAIHRTININLLSHFWMTRAFLPSMIERRSGHVVAISSPSGLMGNSAKFSSFCASQHVVIGAMSALACELEDYPSIRLCTACCPVVVGASSSPITSANGVEVGKCAAPNGLLAHIRKLLGLELPPLNEQAAAIVDAIRRDRDFVFVPKGFIILQFIEQLFPQKLSKFARELLLSECAVSQRVHTRSGTGASALTSARFTNGNSCH